MRVTKAETTASKRKTFRVKANLKTAILYEKITNQRKDFLHKISSKLISDNQTICIEDLAVKNMIKNHNLAQAISDVSWSSFTQMLKYKSKWYSKNLLQIGRFEASSKTCSNCGRINQNLTLAERNLNCNCGNNLDRDLNAAINIKKFALRNSGIGYASELVEFLTLVGAEKQETKSASPTI
jgi:putative transposase